jgi:hypothetical protein
MKPRFEIGTQYLTRGKNSRLCTITDILRTYNSSNELVSIRYVAEHLFMGHVVTERDVCETSILMSHAAMGNPTGCAICNDSDCAV